MNYLYHGSDVAGITALEPRSPLHNSDKRVGYLTGNIPYALIYIWDAKHTGYDRTYVTGWLRDGIASYEEQFPDQFYQNDTVQADFMKKYHVKAWEKAFNTCQTTDSRMSDVTTV